MKKYWMLRYACVLHVVSCLERRALIAKVLRGGATRQDEMEERQDEKMHVFTSTLESIQARLKGMDEGLSFIDLNKVAEKAWEGLSAHYDEAEVDELLASSAAALASRHPDYSRLAARIEISRLRRETAEASCSENLKALEASARKRGEVGILDPELYTKLSEDEDFCKAIDRACSLERFEADLDYFGYKTLERSYLLRDPQDTSIRERPSQALMRVALGIWRGWRDDQSLKNSLHTFELMASRKYIHASPTLFHSGTRTPHLASCFLLGATQDSIRGIYDMLANCASISKAAGGIGLSVSQIRGAGSRIRGTGGESNGLVPMLRVFDSTARYVDQGGGKRPGAIAAYIEPWHPDVFDFLELKKNHGKEERRARDLFYALWIPDLFMRRVKADADWSLMCPDECPGLCDSHSIDFEQRYLAYEAQPDKVRRTVKARTLWRAILDAQMETGTPYLLYKDACNAKSNHHHLGTIQSSNLCCEIIQFANATEVAVCNLASIVLPSFVNKDDNTFDFEALAQVTASAAQALDSTIDSAAYPTPEAEKSNKRHRPLGLGVQGLADAFIKLRLPFDSPQARQLNRDIFETIYFAALRASCDRAKMLGVYETYPGSPTSRGLLQPDLWQSPLSGGNTTENIQVLSSEESRWDWAQLRSDIKRYGLRNSLLVAPMPTASTAQIVGVNECFEPYTSNLYARRVKAGEFVVANRHLVQDLTERGLWDDDLRDDLMRHEGSVQSIERVPDDLKALYKTAWELKQRVLVDLAADRGPYVDQSQSFNAFIATPDYHKLTAFHFYGWSKGLKTGMYYLRTKPAATAIQFTLRPSSSTHQEDDTDSDPNAPPVCLSCSG